MSARQTKSACARETARDVAWSSGRTGGYGVVWHGMVQVCEGTPVAMGGWVCVLLEIVQLGASTEHNSATMTTVQML